ncbi:MAG: hypothetical protein N3E51_00270 [Candidatus Micrarchaeota archaeon]|nr:hypothetical protein [Candidatus Micrarchaeota archaeon]
MTVGIAGAEPDFSLAIVAATISILIGGILFGAGLGFGIRRLRLLGAEEVGQGIISAAMVGAFAAFVLLLDSAVASLVPQSGLPICPSVEKPAGSPYGFYACHLHARSFSLSELSSALSRSADIAGMASSLRVDAGVISAQPFFALQAASQKLSELSFLAGLLSALAFLELEAGLMMRLAAMSIFLPAGLILRSFFATRKLGAAAMAIAISAYAVYPLLFLWGFGASKTLAETAQASLVSEEFNSDFAAIPLLELDDTGAVRSQISQMAEGDFGGKVQLLFAPALRAAWLACLDLAVFPAVSAAISLVAAIELYRLFSAPIFFSYFGAI